MTELMSWLGLEHLRRYRLISHRSSNPEVDKYIEHWFVEEATVRDPALDTNEPLGRALAAIVRDTAPRLSDEVGRIDGADEACGAFGVLVEAETPLRLRLWSFVRTLHQ